MTEPKLSVTLRDILFALIALYEKANKAVRSEKIAEMVNRTPGMVRSHLRALRTLGLVEGVPGPKGGYRPTSKAYELLSILKSKKTVKVPVIVNGRETNLSAKEIDLPFVSHPKICRARIRVLGDVRKISPGDSVVINAMPVIGIMICGKVVGRDDARDKIVIDIEKIFALPKDTVEGHMLPIVAVDANASVREGAKILAESDMYCALVKRGDKLVGIFALDHVAKAIAERKIDARVGEVMRPELVEVERGTEMGRAIRLMKDRNVGILLVTDRGKPVGVITDQKILAWLNTLMLAPTKVGD